MNLIKAEFAMKSLMDLLILSGTIKHKQTALQIFCSLNYNTQRSFCSTGDKICDSKFLPIRF